jgi:hypothetical protein
MKSKSNPYETAGRLEKVAAILAFLDLGPITVEQVKQFDEWHWKLAFEGAKAMGATIKNPAGKETRAEIIKRMTERSKPRRVKR